MEKLNQDLVREVAIAIWKVEFDRPEGLEERKEMLKNEWPALKQKARKILNLLDLKGVKFAVKDSAL
ncbi:MAG: hypothetical protein RID23_08250 [Roseovarius sp.]